MSHSEANSDRDARFDEVCADYLDAADAGQPLDHADVLAAHPDLAESLQKFFADHQRMAGAIGSGATDDANVVETLAASDVATSDVEASVDVRSNADGATRDLSPSNVDQGYTTRPNNVGPTITDYDILEKIAHGGMGVVYRARQRSLNRIVALKTIRSGELADVEEIQRFRAEAEAAAQLQHPGIVPIYQIGECNGQHFFSMAYIEGESLAAKIRDVALLPKIAATYVMKVAEATHYAHQQGIIHRDLKPANVLLDRNDEPLVTDFGLAKQIKGDNELTRSGQILGTASYMSPEQARGDQANIGPHSDVYSLGALLYTLLTQRPPFTGDNPLDILMDVLSKDPDAPSSSNLRLSRDLETICLKCLEKSPVKRYESAERLAEDLQRYLDGRPILARPVTRIERAARWCRRKPAIATAMTLSVLLAVGLPTANYLGVTNRFYERTNTTPTSLVDTAQAYYLDGPGATLLKADASQPDVELYNVAALAMLHYDEDNLDEPGRDYFQQAATLFERSLNQSPEDEGLRFALSDCLIQLSLYKSFELEQRRDYLDRAKKQLTALRTSHADNELVRGRLAFIETRMLALGGSADELTKTLRSLGTDVVLDKATGVIRFDFRLDPIAAVADNLDVQNAHELLVNGDAEAAADALMSLLYRSNNLETLSGLDLQKLFCDLTLLSEDRDEGIKLPHSKWPQNSKTIYNATLGIRLSTTDYANRDFQLRDLSN